MNDITNINEMNQLEQDHYWMRYALTLADKAEAIGEVPVGAVLVLDNQVIGEGFNQVISLNDPTAHAEVLALRQGGETITNYRILDAVLYITLEPCCMCTGAIVHSRIKRVVYGATDLKTGAANSAFALINDVKHNHQVALSSGVLAEQCSTKISDFFAKRRREKKKNRLNGSI
ncbi:tRNA adenosine(34) deaminase TadA [Psychrobium sp. 1_MG-2023]|uniref:tRNA adenosine(34) deaminase TadA n=1 Tax=Psychrobium sp. 1_MG-2023 TaxID=3062624 RepID=UPI000C3447A6|nr:tRNA adenosine(34) deaminase TadA [Psychrobium sp. 1_MG-2023]MDP2560544.1 tRNA adenosine(34) deaminase TadA [Psychrobium sp. 1_MG-2023]PKF57535.1 tRNA adenosine(34) deaminase TadA [Alteromonadales bacterium alter-6D02]